MGDAPKSGETEKNETVFSEVRDTTIRDQKKNDTNNNNDNIKNEEEEEDQEAATDDKDKEHSMKRAAEILSDGLASPPPSLDRHQQHQQQHHPVPYPYYQYHPTTTTTTTTITPNYHHLGYSPYAASYPFYMAATASSLLPPPPQADSRRSPTVKRSKGGGVPYTDTASANNNNNNASDKLLPLANRNRGGVSKSFPQVLYSMLSTLEEEGQSNIASFFSHGRAFAIHKQREFIATVMPRFFKQTKFTSFQRQLNLYTFKRISGNGADAGGYWHPMFLKGREGLCIDIKRIKMKIEKQDDTREEDPNFYAYPRLDSVSTSYPVSTAGIQEHSQIPSTSSSYGYPAPLVPFNSWSYYGGYPPGPSPVPYQVPTTASHNTSYPISASSISPNMYPYGWDASSRRQMPQPSPVQPLGKEDADEDVDEGEDGGDRDSGVSNIEVSKTADVPPTTGDGLAVSDGNNVASLDTSQVPS